MSGTSKAWTPERRARQAEWMRQQNYDREFIAARNAGMKSEFNRIRKAHHMRKLNKRRQTDTAYYERWVAKLRVGLKSPARAARLRDHMIALQRYWHESSDDPGIIEMMTRRGRNAAASRRGMAIPDELKPLYTTLRRKVGMREAVRILAAEIERSP